MSLRGFRCLSIVICFSLSYVCLPCLAFDTWKLTVTYPDGEEKIFALAEDKIKIKLQKSKWNCVVDKTTVNEDINSKSIICTKGTDIVYTLVFCGKRLKVAIATLTLIEKTRSHQLRLLCEDI